MRHLIRFRRHRAKSFTEGCEKLTVNKIDSTVADEEWRVLRDLAQDKNLSLPLLKRTSPSNNVLENARTYENDPSLRNDPACILYQDDTSSSEKGVHGKECYEGVEEAVLSHLLVDGFVLGSRYVIEQGGVTSRHICRFAIDRFTKQRVFIKFYPQLSEKTNRLVQMHARLKKSTSVCKLIEILPNPHGFPPCVVFEAGHCTLAQWLEKRPMSPIEQQDVLHSISQSLRDLHNHSIVHGSLDPSHIAWFPSDFRWKLLNLETASIIGDRIPSPHPFPRRYAAPEMQKTIGGEHMTATAASDMWSFGLVLFEITTGVVVLDAGALKKDMAQERRHLEEQRESILPGRFANGLSKTTDHRQLELNVIRNLLNEHPAKRKTASQMVEVFENGSPLKREDLATILTNFFEGRGHLDGNEGNLVKWFVCSTAVRHLKFSVSAERFVRDKSDSVGAFYERGTTKARSFFDDYLPKHPVHILSAGESFCIRVAIQHDQQLRFPLREITALEVIPPDGQGQFVKLSHQSKGEHTLDTLAFVEPAAFDSERLNKKCPIFGLVDTKYVRVTLHAILKLGEGFPYDIDVYLPMYLQLKRPLRRFGPLTRLRSYGEAVMRAFGS